MPLHSWATSSATANAICLSGSSAWTSYGAIYTGAPARGREVIVYEGKGIEIPEGKSGGITGTASSVHAVDWDGDGVIDLLIGDIGGKVYLIRNEGSKTQNAFAKERQLAAGGKPLRVG